MTEQELPESYKQPSSRLGLRRLLGATTARTTLQAGKSEKASHDTQKIKVPEGILSAEKFVAWGNGYGFGHGKRGTYRTEKGEAYLYVKGCLSVASENDVEPALAMVRHLTASGILHPDTQWGTFKRDDDDFQLFPVSPGLTAVTLNALLERPDKFSSFRIPANQEGSHLLEWCRRVDAEYTPATPCPWDEKVSQNSLVGMLNIWEASHTDNWGYDGTGTFYPVDVEVIRVRGNMDIVHNWHAAE